MGYIKDKRKEAGKSLQEVQEAVGVDRTTYWRYETDRIKNIPRDRLMKLKEVIGLDINEYLESREK